MAVGSGSRRSDLILPLAVLALMAVVDLLLPPTVVIIGAFAIAVFVASVLTTPARTALVALAATVLALASPAWNQDFETVDWWVRVLLTVTFSALAMLLCWIRVKREQALLRMTIIAETAQRALLRILPQTMGPVRLAARYVSASKAALVGGDLYEVADTPYGVRVIVGDARGKGLDAVQMAATVLAGFRRAAFLQPSLAGVAEDLDGVVTSVAGDEDFVTALLVEFHDDHSVGLVNCGHHPPLRIPQTGDAEELETGEPEPPLGLCPTPHLVTTTCPEGERLLIYTDGLIETRDVHGVFFPLAGMVGDMRGGELGEALDGLLSRLEGHAGHDLSDDVALVFAEYRAT
jgi:sigma-B regulation protein RsbU (phosphoserine phosphatase)